MEISMPRAGDETRGEPTPALCLNLLGTIYYSQRGDIVLSASDIMVFPDSEARIWEYRDKGYLVLGLYNDSGVAYGYKTVRQSVEDVAEMRVRFARDPFHLIEVDFHHPRGKVAPYNVRSLMRKPGTGMLALMEVKLFSEGIIVDWDRSLYVGDTETDRMTAANAGIPFEWSESFFSRGAKQTAPLSRQIHRKAGRDRRR